VWVACVVGIVPAIRVRQHYAVTTCFISDIYDLDLRQPDQARTDFAAIECDLEVIQKQLGRLPTRRELRRTALGIIFATMMLTTLSLLLVLR
jgi:hypothetical protein